MVADRFDPERSPAAWVSRPTVQRACAQCGEHFTLPMPSTKYCSPACRGVVEEERRQRRKRPMPPQEG